MPERLTHRPFAVLTALLGAAAGIPSSVAMEAHRPPPTPSSRQGSNPPERNLARERLHSAKRDLALARRVREELQADRTISIEGKSVKVTAADGTVYLRGDVASPAEVLRVERIAERVAGKGHVKNQISQNSSQDPLEPHDGSPHMAE